MVPPTSTGEKAGSQREKVRITRSHKERRGTNSRSLMKCPGRVRGIPWDALVLQLRVLHQNLGKEEGSSGFWKHSPEDTKRGSLRGGKMRQTCSVAQSCPSLCDPVDCSPPGSSVYGDSPGKNTAVGRHALLQGIFPTQGSNPRLPRCRRILYQLRHQGSPKRGGQEGTTNKILDFLSKIKQTHFSRVLEAGQCGAQCCNKRRTKSYKRRVTSKDKVKGRSADIQGKKKEEKVPLPELPRPVTEDS